MAKLHCFDLLNKLFPQLYVSAEVHNEVAITGAGLPGASELEKAGWIQVKQLRSRTKLLTMQRNFALGLGESSTILLGKELNADALLLDDYKARKLAKEEGLEVRGSVGLLEILYARGHLKDLRAAFGQLLMHNAYVDPSLLDQRLRSLGLPVL